MGGCIPPGFAALALHPDTMIQAHYTVCSREVQKTFFFSNNYEYVLKNLPGGPITPKKKFGATVGYPTLTRRHALFLRHPYTGKILKNRFSAMML